MVRVIVTRYAAPASKKKPSVGKRIGPWVYEIYLTALSEERFVPEDIQDLYYGRGAFESMLAEEDIEQEADRWCSHSACGQEFWQIVCQWVWNLRLALGKRMQQAPLRDIEWAPPTCTPAKRVRQPDAELAYGPWQVAQGPAGVTSPLFGARDFVWHDDGTLHCPAGLASRKAPIVQEDKTLAQRVIYEARRTDCQTCDLREKCRPPQSTGRRGRNVTAVRSHRWLKDRNSPLPCRWGHCGGWISRHALFGANGSRIGGNNGLRSFPPMRPFLTSDGQ